MVGVAIVAIGGGGIQPMRTRCENALNKMDEERPRMQRARQQAQEQGLLDLTEAERTQQPAAATTGPTTSRNGSRRARR